MSWPSKVSPSSLNFLHDNGISALSIVVLSDFVIGNALNSDGREKNLHSILINAEGFRQRSNYLPKQKGTFLVQFTHF